MSSGILIEFGGLPGTGKSTLAARLAEETAAVWLRIDEIEAAMRRNGLTSEQTGVAAYSVAHDVATNHLRRGLMVIADAVNPVSEARDGWRGLATSVGCDHLVVETVCPDGDEHRDRQMQAAFTMTVRTCTDERQRDDGAEIRNRGEDTHPQRIGDT